MFFVVVVSLVDIDIANTKELHVGGDYRRSTRPESPQTHVPLGSRFCTLVDYNDEADE